MCCDLLQRRNGDPQQQEWMISAVGLQSIVGGAGAAAAAVSERDGQTLASMVAGMREAHHTIDFARSSR